MIVAARLSLAGRSKARGRDAASPLLIFFLCATI
jgi:hypothetical protein